MSVGSQNDNQYFRMAVVIVLISMAALIVFHLYYFIHTGLVFHLIPVVLCLMSFAVCIPLMGYLKKISDGNSQAGYFQAANLFAVFSMVSFLLIRLPEYMDSALYFDVIALLIYSLLVIGVMLFLIIRAKSPVSLAFHIPAAAFVFFTVGSIIHGGVGYYFLVYLLICGFGALYASYERYRNFVLLSHVVILGLILADVPFLGPGISRKTIILYWMLAAYVTAFFLMLSRFSTEKSSRSERAQHTFGTMMATTPNLLVMVDEMNRVTYISQALAELGHIEEPEMARGRPIIDLFHDIHMKLAIGEVVESEGFYDGTMEILHNGKKQYLKITSNTFSGEIPGRFIDMSDITLIRTALFEAEEAKARAEEANLAKSAFLARMSHEIRTPMNAITGLSELILREKASPVVYEYATAVKQAGGNLVAIINDILDFSKIESGKMEIIPIEYDFSSLINDVITIICIRLREKPIYFVVNIDPVIPGKLYGDVVRVRQVLINILSNAVKYTNRGHIIFTIEAESWGEESINLKFEVVDTGIGIKQEDLGKIFGDFSRLDSRHNYEVEGTGLGLAITQSLCHTMGGDVSVESVYEEGSAFTAYIPQEFRDKTPFAKVIDPETKKVLIYETREVYGNSLVCSLDNLGVSCKLVTGIDELRRALKTASFGFIMAASFLFDKAREEIQKQGIDTILVLLAEYGAVVADRQTRFIAMPAHSLSIAHILNGEEELRYYTETHAGVPFTAPDAHILIVDDIKTNLTVAEGLLIPYALQVDSCLTGKEAIGLIQKNNYDLVLMDHMMPGMNGIETTARIREWEASERKNNRPGAAQGIPIIALTANAISGMKELFLQSGFNDYLSKPIEIIKLNEIMERWIPAEKQKKNTAKIRLDSSCDNGGLVIEGVEVNRGISLTGGTGEGYRKVLVQFALDAAERLDWLEDFFTKYREGDNRRNSEPDLAGFTTRVHALKGAAATIGAAEAAKDAAALEAAGRAGDAAVIGELLPAFLARLVKLIRAIEDALRKNGGKESGDKKDWASIKGQFWLLRAALEAKNMKEIDRLIAEIEAEAAGQMRKGINAVSDKVLMGEYKAAISEIERLAGDISV
ncbi:MAG: response regulator [Spirochaetaceae bacterium]|jgi:signal transduction histidine kinase/FixJ family two-component response regulator/HPt (histidine-containing phosphotransfer) domain-containing protein|nr:response regulator [Spirochaetaceae bacterium]